MRNANPEKFNKNLVQIIKDNKIAVPVTRAGIKQICKLLNIHCTETMSFEALIACRGKELENSQFFSLEKLSHFLNVKSKIAPPADNPRAFLHNRSRMPSHTVRGTNRRQVLPNQIGKFPPLPHTIGSSHGRSKLNSRQSYDSQDARITQGFRNRTVKRNNREGLLSRQTQGSLGEVESDGNDYAFDKYTVASPSVKMSPAKMRKALEKDSEFQGQMDQTLESLGQRPKLRAKVLENVAEIATRWERRKGEEGIMAGEATRKMIAIRKREREAAAAKNLEMLISETAATSALQAINLS